MSEDLAAFENRLERFYSHYAPDKIQTIPEVLEKYGDKQEALMRALERKYGLESTIPSDFMPEFAPVEPQADAEFAARIRRFVAYYDPPKMDKVPGLLNRYGTKPAALLRTLEQQYGPESDIPLDPVEAARGVTAAEATPTQERLASSEAAESPVAHDGAESGGLSAEASLKISMLETSRRIGPQKPTKAQRLAVVQNLHVDGVDDKVVARVRRFIAFYDARKLPMLPMLLKHKGHNPERLMSDLQRQYGSEKHIPDEEFIKRVLRFVAFYDADRLRLVPGLLRKYGKKPEKLMRLLQKQYGPEKAVPTEQRIDDFSKADQSSLAALSADMEDYETCAPTVPEERIAREALSRLPIEVRVQRFMEFYAPEKAEVVPKLLEQHGDKPGALMRSLEKRYGPESAANPWILLDASQLRGDESATSQTGASEAPEPEVEEEEEEEDDEEIEFAWPEVIADQDYNQYQFNFVVRPVVPELRTPTHEERREQERREYEERVQRALSVTSEGPAADIVRPELFAPMAGEASPGLADAPLAFNGSPSQGGLVRRKRVSDRPPPTRAEHRARLELIYRRHAPHKLGSLDIALDAYSGREKLLFAALRERYGTDDTTRSPDGSDDDAPPAAPPPVVFSKTAFDYVGAAQSIAEQADIMFLGPGNEQRAASILLMMKRIGPALLFDPTNSELPDPALPFSSVVAAQSREPIRPLDRWAFSIVNEFHRTFAEAVAGAAVLRREEYARRAAIYSALGEALRSAHYGGLVMVRAMESLPDVEAERRGALDEEERAFRRGLLSWFRRVRDEHLIAAQLRTPSRILSTSRGPHRVAASAGRSVMGTSSPLQALSPSASWR